MNYDKIGNFIKKLRNDMNLTQKELASKIKVTDKAISKWERGLGCPDVSLLEDLSKVLDVSILELLKGERIDNISIEESNKYIKEGATYSKNIVKDKIKNALNYSIFGIVICIILYIGYLNIIHYITLNKTYTYEAQEYERDLNSIIDKIDIKMNIINNNQGIFNIEDYELIKYKINEYYNLLKANKMYDILYNYKTIKYKIKDLSLYTIDNRYKYILNTRDIIDIIKKYKDKELYTIIFNNYLLLPYVANNLNTSMYYSYKYSLTLDNTFIDMYYIDNKELEQYRYIINSDALNLLQLLNIVMEVGEINE